MWEFVGSFGSTLAAVRISGRTGNSRPSTITVHFGIFLSHSKSLAAATICSRVRSFTGLLAIIFTSKALYYTPKNNHNNYFTRRIPAMKVTDQIPPKYAGRRFHHAGRGGHAPALEFVRKYTTRAQLKPSGAPEPASVRGRPAAAGDRRGSVRNKRTFWPNSSAAWNIDAFRVPHLSANTPEAAFHGQAGRPCGRACGTRAHPRGPPWPGRRRPRAEPQRARRTGRERWSLSSTSDSRSTPAVRAPRSLWRCLGWSGGLGGASSSTPRRALTVYFCTNLVGTLEASTPRANAATRSKTTARRSPRADSG